MILCLNTMLSLAVQRRICSLNCSPMPLAQKKQDMQMLRHTKTLGIIQVEETVWKHLTRDEKDEIGRICDDKLQHYYLAQEGKVV